MRSPVLRKADGGEVYLAKVSLIFLCVLLFFQHCAGFFFFSSHQNVKIFVKTLGDLK